MGEKRYSQLLSHQGKIQIRDHEMSIQHTDPDPNKVLSGCLEKCIHTVWVAPPLPHKFGCCAAKIYIVM